MKISNLKTYSITLATVFKIIFASTMHFSEDKLYRKIRNDAFDESDDAFDESDEQLMNLMIHLINLMMYLINHRFLFL